MVGKEKSGLLSDKNDRSNWYAVAQDNDDEFVRGAVVKLYFLTAPREFPSLRNGRICRLM